MKSRLMVGRPGEVLGFTGTASLPPSCHARVDAALEWLVKKFDPARIVTGACVGIDAYVHHWFHRNYPDILRTVVFPGDLKSVDLTTDQTTDQTADEVIRMPSSGKGSTYRDRNEELVKRSTVVAAFWTGQQRSGTFMTMNIAWRAKKLPGTRETIFGIGLPDDEVRIRYSNARFYNGKNA